MARNGPQVKLPSTMTTGFVPMSFESWTVSLPSGVDRVKLGAGSSSRGPSCIEPISPLNKPRTSTGMAGTSPGEKPDGPRDQGVAEVLCGDGLLPLPHALEELI